MLYKQFVAWNCNGCSIAPLTDYIHNPIYQELPEETPYTDETEKLIQNWKKRFNVNLANRAKKSFKAKMRLLFWGYSLSKYL